MARLIARRDACPNFNEAATPSVVHYNGALLLHCITRALASEMDREETSFRFVIDAYI